MSESLATLPTLSLSPTCALARAQAGNLLPEGVSPASLAPEEDDDYADIEARHKVLQGNGQVGQFLDRDDSPETAKGPDEVTGVIIADVATQLLFAPNKQARGRYEMYGLRVLNEAPRYICRCTDLRSKPELNPGLTPEQLEEAVRLGLGGATGKRCVECPMSGKMGWLELEGGQKVKPPCTHGRAMVWLDSQKEEPAVLRFLGESARNWERFVARHFKVGRRSMMPYQNVVSFRFRAQQGEDGKYYSVEPRVVERTPPEQHPLYLAIRQALGFMVQESLEDEMRHLESLAEQEARVDQAETGGRVWEPPGSEGGITIDEEGNPVYESAPF